jgi:hypothetical protein
MYSVTYIFTTIYVKLNQWLMAMVIFILEG